MNSTPNKSQQGNILVVDDIPANLQLLVGLLSEQGYKVRPMPSGKLALQGIHLDYPDLILLDIQMPDMNGYEVCKQLKSDDRTRDIPVIFISSLDDIFDKIEAFKVGGIDYVTKPFHAEEVFARVNTHITLYRFQKRLQEKTKVQDRQLQEKNILLEQMLERLKQTNQELQEHLDRLQKAQLQLVQSEKMATLGQLVAGVAHEINNPVGFIEGNIGHSLNYVQDLINLVNLYQDKLSSPDAEIQDYIEDIELDFLIEDLPKTIASMKTGADRIRNISDSLRTFSRGDSDRKVSFNIHKGIDSAILILKHRLKDNGDRPAIDVLTEYGELPEIDCFPGQLSQVFMNLVANAIDALDEAFQDPAHCQPQKITIKTEIGEAKDKAIVWIEDNGIGMSEELNVARHIVPDLATNQF